MLAMASLVAMVARHAPDMVVANTDKLVASLERGLELLQVGGMQAVQLDVPAQTAALEPAGVGGCIG